MDNEVTYSLKKSPASGFIEQLAEQWEGEISADCQRHQLNLPPDLGEGQLMSYSVGSGLDAVIFDLQLKRPLTFHLGGDFNDPISFYTLASGKLEVKSNQRDFSMQPLQCTIHGGFGMHEAKLQFPANGEPIVAMISFVHKESFFDEIDCNSLDIPHKLLEVVKDIHDISKGFIFQDIFHLPAINAVQDILSQQQIGLLNSTFAAGKIHENLFLQLNEYKKFVVTNNARFIRDSEKIKIIRNAESILVSHLQEPPTIPVLAKMVGINQQTLKQGFRQLYGITINQYLTDKRLEQAGVLIRGGELSLRQVAVMVGYENPSYFSRKFKEKYGVPPREFLSLENHTVDSKGA